jgi:hypothetical protein
MIVIVIFYLFLLYLLLNTFLMQILTLPKVFLRQPKDQEKNQSASEG